VTRFLFRIFFTVLPISLSAQSQFQRGLIWEDNRYNALPVHYTSNALLPSSKNLKSFYPRVVIQPKADYTGVAWAAVWNARTAAEAMACNQTDVSKIRAISFSPAYNYGLVRKTPDCHEPVSMIDLLESMVKNGSVYFSEFSDVCPSEIPSSLSAMAKNKKLSGYFKLYNTGDNQNIKVNSVKGAIASRNAVVAGMIYPPSLHLAQDFWQPRESQPDQQYGGHAVCIVGYDDTKFGGAFEVVNTWGKEWATQGYTWIRYKDFADYFPYAFSMFQIGSASCNVSFEGNVAFKLLTGEEMPVTTNGPDSHYKFSKQYPSGTTFTIEMSSNVPAYVYSFGVDPANEYFPLFPRVATTMPITFTTLRAPDDMPALTLTDPPGKNVVYFVFSPTALDFNKVMSNFKSHKSFDAALTPVKWDNQNLRFNGDLTAPIMMQVVLDQTKK
jgi:hypothetical protein